MFPNRRAAANRSVATIAAAYALSAGSRGIALDLWQALPRDGLAGVVGNKVEAAYRRGDLFDKRRALG